MNMKDVKAITIPQGTVKKIENSNGDIIWGSPDAFPYRRLEYIHFNGAEYIETNLKPTQNTFHYLNCSFDDVSHNYCPIGVAGDNTSNGNMRISISVNANGYYQCRYGRNSSTDESVVAISNNTQYSCLMRLYQDNRAWIAINDMNDTQLGSKYYGTAVSWTSSNMNTIKLGAYTWAPTSTSALLKGNIYRHYMRTGDDSGTITYDRYPCQRKSDGVCGLYDVKTNTFLPMTGTTTTSSAAGPVVDEYWDLTAPS